MPAFAPPDFVPSSISGHRWRGGSGVGRSRAIALALTIALHVLVVLVIVYMRAPLPQRKEERSLTSFNISPPPPVKPEQAKVTARKQGGTRTRTASDSPPSRPQTQQQPVPSEVQNPVPSAFIQMDSAQFAASDISKMGKGPPAAGTGNSKAVQGPGEGPGGAVLYGAEWAKRPTDAELRGYLPPNAPREGWGLVACRTIPGNRVDNCQTIGESPPGSGFARAVRQAAWQFHVRPPRVNGKPEIGEWVRIRISYGVQIGAED